MEAPDQRVQFLDAGDFLRLPIVLRMPTSAARSNDHEPRSFTLKQVACSSGYVRQDDLTLQFHRCEIRVLGRVAAEAIFSLIPSLHHGVAARPFRCRTLILPGGEGVDRDHGRMFAKNGRNLSEPPKRTRSSVHNVGQLARAPI